MNREFLFSGKIIYSVEKKEDTYIIGTSIKDGRSKSFHLHNSKELSEKELKINLIEEIACLFGLNNYKLVEPNTDRVIMSIIDDDSRG